MNRDMNIIRKEKVNYSIDVRLFMTFLLISFLFFSFGCGKNSNDPGFNVDFTFSFQDDNHVRFTNTSEGEYYSLTWDFGNGQTDITTDKKKTYVIYYPEAGDYDVSLKCLDYSGNTDQATRKVTVTSTDLEVSFTTQVDPLEPNYVDLKNTTQGSYESFKWIYRNREVEDEDELTAYFPYAGSYLVELQIVKNNKVFSHTEEVNITGDDPDYPDKFTLVWSDEFEGTSVNTDHWTFETGANGWGNNELQNYTNGDNAEVVDGMLVITARKLDENMEPGSYTSSRLITENKKEFQYGKMEIRAKLPSGRGIWPAIWMLGDNFRTDGWPLCGEMDIMEYVGYEPNVIHSTVHTASGSGANGSGSSMALETCEEEFHIYGLIWSEQKLIFYVDDPGNIVHTYAPASKNEENWPFNQPAFFILNVAVGGNWGGAQGIDNSIFPQSMEIDYVRAYQEIQ